MTSGPWARLNDRALDAIEDLFGGLSGSSAELIVPATPQWTVRQVLAHLAGAAADVTSGRMDGAPGEAWTTRHVAERQDRSFDELIAELRSTQRAFGIIAEGASAAVFNVVVHHADLLEALGEPRQDEELHRPVLEHLRHRWSELGLRLPDDPADPGLREVDPYLLYRALFTRLERAEVRALVGDAPSEDQVDRLGLFGPPPG